MSWIKASLLVVLLSAAALPESEKSGRHLADSELCAAEPTDLTEPALKVRLATAKRWSAVGPVKTEYPRPGVKISTQRYAVIDGNDQMIMVSASCSGSCGETCDSSGCDLSSGACTRVTCAAGGENCNPSCTKISTF